MIFLIDKYEKLALFCIHLHVHVIDTYSYWCKLYIYFFFVGNDVKVVQKKIDSVQARFTELRDKVIDSTEQMEEALPLAQNFNDAHAEFLDWVFKTESQLRTKEATGQEAEEQVQVGESS